MNGKYLIPGKFLGLDTVGLSRKAKQYTMELDKHAADLDIVLAVPADVMDKAPQLTNIKVVEAPATCKNWNTHVAMKMAKEQGRTYLSLSSPFTKMRDSIVAIDDVRYMEKHDGAYYDTTKFRLKTYISAQMGTTLSRDILTVSNFSKSRIQHFFGTKDSKITVIPNGWEHINDVEPDNSIIDKYPELEKGQFYFTLGSLAKHKNHQLIVELAQHNPDTMFVIGGGFDSDIFWDASKESTAQNVIFTGKMNDGEIKAMMTACKAFIFPSLYEGFGIPPLEALACGADVIISDIDVHKEIFKNSVHYIKTDDYDVNLAQILAQPVDSADQILTDNSWKRAGEMLSEFLHTRNY